MLRIWHSINSYGTLLTPTALLMQSKHVASCAWSTVDLYNNCLLLYIINSIPCN